MKLNLPALFASSALLCASAALADSPQNIYFVKDGKVVHSTTTDDVDYFCFEL